MKTKKKPGPKKKGHKTPTHTGRTRAAKKEAKAVAAVPAGEKLGAIAERRKQAEAKKLEKIAAMDSRTIEVLGVLEPVAKEINVKFKLAAQLDGKADDHRLSAALLLESARRRCKEAKLSFATWCEEHVEKSYDEVRKLVAVAASPEPAKALADLRAGAAARNRDMRERRRVSRDAQDSSAPAETPWEAADALVESLSDQEALSLIEARAGPLGMALVSETSVNRLKQLDDFSSELETVEDMKDIFVVLNARDKLEFVQWAAQEIGAEVIGDFQEDAEDFQEDAEDNLTDIPSSLRREP